LKAVDEWSERRKKELQDQAAISRKIMLGRTGSERLASDTVKASTDLTVDEINAFLDGGP
jgi:hypothetical protein